MAEQGEAQAGVVVWLTGLPSAGKSPTSICGRRHSTTARSTAFSSSRTLPGQS